MLKVLVPIDGSKSSSRVVDHLIEQSGERQVGEVHLLNAQPPISGHASSFVSRSTLARYHQEEGNKALKAARRKLDAAKIKYQYHIVVGDPAETIARYAREKKCDLVIMGTRGMGSVSNMVLGSVATKVIHLSPVPVTLVK
jgi:nucleotide-binding universal stress UspA family protein